MTAEPALARALVQTRARRARRAEEIVDLAARADPEPLLALLGRLRLEALAGERLAELGAALPPGLPERVAARRRFGELHEVATDAAVATVAGAGIEVMPLKGSWLSRRLFGHPGLRATGDIDLLVPLAQLGDATRALAREGWAGAPEARPLLHAVLPHPDGLPTVELHWRAHWYEDEFAAGALERGSVRPDGGREPLPADELALLLLFLARDGFVGLRQLADVAGWQDAHRDGPRRCLDPILSDHPALRRALLTAARVAEDAGALEPGVASTQPVPRAPGPRLAARLADPEARAEPVQLYHDATLVDGLLSPRGGRVDYVRRHLLPPAHVMRSRQPRLADAPAPVVALATLEHMARTLRRYALRALR